MTAPPDWQPVAAVSIGAVAGAEARYGISQALPADPDEFPWATLLINGTGCFLIGVLMVATASAGHPLLRPLLGAGVLGGYTTFSAYSEETRALLDTGHEGAALAYLALTPVLAVLAVWLGTTTTRRLGSAP